MPKQTVKIAMATLQDCKYALQTFLSRGLGYTLTAYDVSNLQKMIHKIKVVTGEVQVVKGNLEKDNLNI